jgi:SAM-dependent methyltransferase
MEARVQRRVQRYGWDLAAHDYERLWQAQLGPAQADMLARVELRAGERVVDVACGTGLVSFAAADVVGAGGAVLGVDISGAMVDAARRRADALGVDQASFARMDAEALDLADAGFDVALCGLGLMYVPDPARAVAEMRRVVRPGGRIGLAVWGERSRCGWSAVFPIVDAEVASDVCPLFFGLGTGDALARVCDEAGLAQVELRRIATTLVYDVGDEACDAALVGGPVALAWSRFDAATRERVRASYRDAISPWRRADGGYRIPGEFVVAVAARADSDAPADPADGVVEARRRDHAA